MNELALTLTTFLVTFVSVNLTYGRVMFLVICTFKIIITIFTRHM